MEVRDINTDLKLFLKSERKEKDTKHTSKDQVLMIRERESNKQTERERE